ncbi:hypothetical protein DVH24_002106 [Malus domestica]|uniref:Ribosomal protein L30 ferredoxin-like fold domain-containing protein n=1 Tax=Malus domestica TaxID=3750 RepID=A0A498I4C0_MALDO|nr:hypothetical protein DVH24_002106 [Malus domestica]
MSEIVHTKNSSLCREFNGVFLEVNKARLNMFHRVEPYVTCGYPNLKSVKEGGYGKLNKLRTALTDNSVVEQALGKFGIICVDDLIHDILTVRPHFKDANNFLWPFKLKAPLGGLKKKRNHCVEDGDAGNREDSINELIRRMNYIKARIFLLFEILRCLRILFFVNKIYQTFSSLINGYKNGSGPLVAWVGAESNGAQRGARLMQWKAEAEVQVVAKTPKILDELTGPRIQNETGVLCMEMLCQ